MCVCVCSFCFKCMWVFVKVFLHVLFDSVDHKKFYKKKTSNLKTGCFARVGHRGLSITFFGKIQIIIVKWYVLPNLKRHNTARNLHSFVCLNARVSVYLCMLSIELSPFCVIDFVYLLRSHKCCHQACWKKSIQI